MLLVCGRELSESVVSRCEWVGGELVEFGLAPVKSGFFLERCYSRS
jgi:hypothetical protein